MPGKIFCRNLQFEEQVYSQKRKNTKFYCTISMFFKTSFYVHLIMFLISFKPTKIKIFKNDKGKEICLGWHEFCNKGNSLDPTSLWFLFSS